MGQCPDAATLLGWAESRGKTEITSQEVKACAGSLCLDADPIQVSQAVWSWLQVPLMGTGTPEVDYNNAETLNGLEVWRRLSVPSMPRSAAKRFMLRDSCLLYTSPSPRD